MYELEWRTVSALTRGLFWCLFKINTKITLNWAQKHFVARVPILFNFVHDITNPQMTIKTTIFTHRPRVSPALLPFWWWHHVRLLMTSQWADNCDAITNSLDIDFIPGDIHGRSFAHETCTIEIGILYTNRQIFLKYYWIIALITIGEGVLGLPRRLPGPAVHHYNDVIMSAMASQIPASRLFAEPLIQGADQRKHQHSASRASVRGIHR